jgi:uncharacterized protein (DUF2267 family)
VDELIKLVSSKAGITPEQAKKAVETVASFMKERLPAPWNAHVDNLLKGDVSGLGGMLGGVGGLFGKK